MRAFLFPPKSETGLRARPEPHSAPAPAADRRRFKAALLTIALLALSASAGLAQYPGQLAGRVLDQVSQTPIEAVLVEVVGTGASALSDGRGEFSLRGLEPGRHIVRFSRLGYETRTEEVNAANGQRVWLAVDLIPRPIELGELRSQVARGREAAQALFIPRSEIEATGAADAAEALEGRGGLVVTRRGTTGPATVSIRGSAADQVLVLLDGSPLADPMTGSADLSTVPATQIESITVLKGSQSARYGPGAEAGVVLIRTRSIPPALSARMAGGSLGDLRGTAETGGDWLGVRWSGGGGLRSVDGSFDYERPAVLGGGGATRVNTDLEEISTFLTAAGSLAGGELRVRGGLNMLERGLPGPSFLPTVSAREDLTRWRAQAGWDRAGHAWRLSVRAHGLSQVARFSDPAPPAGLPYDSRTEARVLGGRTSLELDPGGRFRHFSLGIEAQNGWYKGSELTATAPDGRLDLSVFTAAELNPIENALAISGALRLDRDQLSDRWHLTHEAMLTAHAGPADLHIRHASSYSPPSFGDQFFQEGVAVAPNPDLRAERVPSEWNVGIGAAGDIGSRVRVSLRLEGYLADVRDMILWAPDFRFVWSPRNFDVRRRGLEIGTSLEVPHRALRLEADYSLTRATYDRPGDDVQVIYRPLHSGGAAASWGPGPWDLFVGLRYIGTRYPVPARLNALDPIWTVDLRVRRSFEAGGWRLTPAVYVDRLFDNEESLIFGYPEPGRTVRLEIAAARR